MTRILMRFLLALLLAALILAAQACTQTAELPSVPLPQLETGIPADPTSSPLPRLETGMHTAAIWRIATDAAGRWAVTASEDKTARVWEVATGQQVAVLRPPQDAGDEGKLYAVAMSPDGSTVAVGGWTSWDWEKKASIYLFDRASARLQRRIAGLPNVIIHLAYSPDGRWLAASLGGKNGVRVFDATSGAETGRDTDYGDQSCSAHFSTDSRRVVTTCFDGRVRLYAVEAGRLRLLKAVKPGGGEQPFAARFSPDGRSIVVGFTDSRSVQVLDGGNLTEIVRLDTTGVENGNLSSVAWSIDGRYLVAGGRWNVGGHFPMRRWPVGDWSHFHDLPLATNTLMDSAPLPDGGVLFAAHDPTWGVLDRDGQLVRRQDGVLADLRGQTDQLRLSADGRRVRFGYKGWGKDARVFDVATRSLEADDPGLAAARTTGSGLLIENWKNRTDPRLNGQSIEFEPYETSRSLAITADGGYFVLGADYWLRLYRRDGTLEWRQPVPGIVWAVNLSADGRYVVAGYGDGTIRWHRFADGKEVLAFFPHADCKRWIAWTPEGFYATSGPDAEPLMGYHLNRGTDHEGEFVSAAQLREQFYQPELIACRLDAGGDRLLAEAVQKLGDVRRILSGTQGRTPKLELLSKARVKTNGEVVVKVRASDQGGGVGRLIWRIDGVEIEGRRAEVAADGTESRSFSLPQGRQLREITVSALNTRGVESPPVRIEVEVRPRQQAAPALYVLAVGVSHYRDKTLEAGVRYAAQDAQAMGALFEEQGRRLYRKVLAKVLVDQEASGPNIRAALEQFASQIAAQDVFVLYLAGHGASFERNYHFIPWDAVYTSTSALRQRSLTDEQFRDLLRKIPAKHTAVLLDTCSAGGFGRMEGRGLGEKEAIDRLSHLTGRAMIAATTDEKMAIEGEGGHGVFTYALLEGLHGKAERNGNDTIEVRELADYVEEVVPKITKKWGFEQLPFSSTEGHSFSLVPMQP